MERRGFLVSGLSLIAVAGCAGGGGSDPRPVMTRSYDLQGFRFSALEGLVVSEENNLYPNVDIVWRGDPRGPRIPQIGAMFSTAAERNRSFLQGSQPIDVEVTLVRFHGVTERTRGSIGGVYNIVFNMTVKDANTGAILEPTRRVVGNLDAPGGAAAQELDAQGQTEKVRVTNFLTALLRNQLT